METQHYVAETVQQRFGVRARTIYNGIDTRFFFPNDKPVSTKDTRPITVLYAGSFRPWKRVELVIEQALRWPKAHFHLAGCGETEEHCRMLCEKNNCRNVYFLGHLPLAQLGEEMRKGSHFSFSQAFSKVILKCWDKRLLAACR